MKRSLFCLLALVGCGGDSTSPTQFVAQYSLFSVLPDWNVPVGGSGSKNITAGCMDFQAGGVLIRRIAYTVTPSGGIPSLVNESDTWSYTVQGSDLIVTDPIGNGSVPETKRIAATSDTGFSIYTILRNGGTPASRTLGFRRGPCSV